MSEFQPLIDELRVQNQLTTSLLKEKKADDTPKQLLAGNLFEIFAQYDIFRKRTEAGLKSAGEIGGANAEKNKESLSNNIAEGLIKTTNDKNGLSFVSFILEQTHDLVSSGLTLIAFNQAKALEFESKRGLMTAETKQFVENEVKRADRNYGLFKDIAIESTKSIKDFNKNVTNALTAGFADSEENPFKDKLFKDDTIKVTAVYKDGSNVEKPPSESESEEDKKDERSFIKKMIDAIIHPINTLKSGFKSFTESFTVGNATLATLLTLFVTGMIAFFPKIANFIAAIGTMIGAIITGDAVKFGQVAADNFGSLTLLTLFFARKKILSVMAPIVTAMASKGLAMFYATTIGGFLKKLAVGVMALNPISRIALAVFGLIGLFIDSIVEGFKAGSFRVFVASVFTKILDMFTGLLSALGSGLKFLFGGGETTKPQGMAAGGPVAAGVPYIVGEEGPELFVPGAAGGIVPNMGGGNIVVNNNQVNQSASSATHQHSNVTIVDRQQEQTGL